MCPFVNFEREKRTLLQIASRPERHLCHSFGSRALAQGHNLTIIDKLFGYRQP